MWHTSYRIWIRILLLQNTTDITFISATVHPFHVISIILLIYTLTKSPSIGFIMLQNERATVGKWCPWLCMEWSRFQQRVKGLYCMCWVVWPGPFNENSLTRCCLYDTALNRATLLIIFIGVLHDPLQRQLVIPAPTIQRVAFFTQALQLLYRLWFTIPRPLSAITR